MNGSVVTLAKVLKGLEKNRPVVIDYVKADGSASRRTVEVYDVLISKAGDVCIKALDTAKGESRTFRLDRIVSATVCRGRSSFLTRMRAMNPNDVMVRELMDA